jgi:hypothetical protein
MHDTVKVSSELTLLANFLKGLSLGTSLSSLLLLLRGPIPGVKEAKLDAHKAVLRTSLQAIEAACHDLTFECSDLSKTLEASPTLASACDLFIELSLLLCTKHTQARRLGLALARLHEEGPRLLARSSRSLGRGFEPLFEQRLKCRFSYFPEHTQEPRELDRCWQLLLEEPEEAYERLEQSLERSLTAKDREWIELERRAGLLRFVRRDKTDSQGHIRWYLRPDSKYDYVLDRLGVEGHWFLPHCKDVKRGSAAVTAFERVFGHSAKPGQAWNELCCDKSLWSPRDKSLWSPRQARQQLRREPALLSHKVSINHEAMVPCGQRKERSQRSWSVKLHLTKTEVELHCNKAVVAALPREAGESALIEFFDVLDAVSDLAPIEACDDLATTALGSWLVAFLSVLTSRARALDQRQGGHRASRRVRLLYLPSDIPHQLGGVPEVGAQFLRDRLERSSRDCLFIKMERRDFHRRLPELLGADVVGIGVYIHNREQVAELCDRLRSSGYQGRIVLGGPETRSIEDVQEQIPGWDAIIRGEADEVLGDVLDVFDSFDAGDEAAALAKALRLSGVSLRLGTALLLCHTASRNRSSDLLCPLPFEWRASPESLLKMNFSRGCPYLCNFCPNHQGRSFRAGTSDELWRFSVLAVGSQLRWPEEAQKSVASAILKELGVAAPALLRPALHIMLRGQLSGAVVLAIMEALRAWIDPVFRSPEGRQALHRSLGLSSWLSLEKTDKALSVRELRAYWLQCQCMVLASRQLWREEGSHKERLRRLKECQGQRFTIETSEDNTLVNRAVIKEYLSKRDFYGLSGDFLFNPGQNTIRDLMTGDGQVDEDFIALLVRENPFAVAFGADGTSNAVLRQNRKPGYGVRALVAVNKALGKYDIEVANNYILLTAETSLLEAVESFVLWLLLPISWRDYGSSINLRVIKEETTLTNDEGLLFDPTDAGWDVPIRDKDLQSLIDRWDLSSLLSAAEFLDRLTVILEKDELARGLLPTLFERWRLDVDGDREMKALAALLEISLNDGCSLLEALWKVRARVQSEALINGRTRQSLEDLFDSTYKQPSKASRTSV